MNSLVPDGYTLVRFPNEVRIERDGRAVASVPVPYDPMTPEQWREVLAAAIKKGSK